MAVLVHLWALVLWRVAVIVFLGAIAGRVGAEPAPFLGWVVAVGVIAGAISGVSVPLKD